MEADRRSSEVARLRALSAREVYSQAVRAGIEVATKHASFGVDENALEKWYEAHPAFSDPTVRALMDQGAAESFQEFYERASQIPGLVGIINANGTDVDHYPLDSK